MLKRYSLLLINSSFEMALNPQCKRKSPLAVVNSYRDGDEHVKRAEQNNFGSSERVHLKAFIR